MKRIGIIGAMADEVARLKEEMDVERKLSRASMEFYVGKLRGRDAVVVQSGIGKVNAGICTQILADEFQVGAVINTGIAGSLDSRIDIGDIVISTDALQHDVDAVKFGYPLGQIPGMDTLSFAADEGLAAAAKAACADVIPEVGIWSGRVVTGDQFIADRAVKERIVSNFGGCCTEMEGAAIAQAAYLNHVPFLILRAISDKADDSAAMDYPAFEQKAIEHSVRLVLRMLEML